MGSISLLLYLGFIGSSDGPAGTAYHFIDRGRENILETITTDTGNPRGVIIPKACRRVYSIRAGRCSENHVGQNLEIQDIHGTITVDVPFDFASDPQDSVDEQLEIEHVHRAIPADVAG
jgi:hypothetical protein